MMTTKEAAAVALTLGCVVRLEPLWHVVADANGLHVARGSTWEEALAAAREFLSRSQPDAALVQRLLF